MLPKAEIREHKSSSFDTELISAFNGYTMVDRSFAIPTNKGPIIQVGLYSATACSWRPKIVVDAFDKYETIYSHPSIVSHTGSGWQWVDVPRITPNGVPAYVAGYFSGNPGTIITVTSGPRSEHNSDTAQGSLLAFTHGNYSTPALAARTQGIVTPLSYFTNFKSNKEGVGSWATSQTVSASAFTTSGWTVDDDNHIDGAGLLSLLIFINRVGMRIGLPSSVVHRKADFRKARVFGRVRGTNYDPKDSHVYPWIQGANPLDLTKFANYYMHGMDLNSLLTSGNWETFDFELSDDENDWTWANGNASKPTPQYSTQIDFNTTVVNGENFHLPAVRPVGTPAPTGTIDWDYIGITVDSVE